MKTTEQAKASRRCLLFSALLPLQWSVATGADKDLVGAKTKVCDLVMESLTLCHSAGGERETGRNTTEN